MRGYTQIYVGREARRAGRGEERAVTHHHALQSGVRGRAHSSRRYDSVNEAAGKVPPNCSGSCEGSASAPTGWRKSPSKTNIL